MRTWCGLFLVNGNKVLHGVGRYVVVAVGTTSRIIMAHQAPARVLFNKLLTRLLTRLCLVHLPEVLPTAGSVTERNTSISREGEVATPTNLRGCSNIPVFVFLSCHCSAGH